MIKFLHSYVAVVACVLTLTSLHYTSASKKHNINEYLVENKRTSFTKQNYVMQNDRNYLDSLLNTELYEETPPQPISPLISFEGEGSRKEDDLPALIVDYANMIRNDILLLDNSVETRTQKRGNANGIKPNRTERDLGEEYYPRYIETKVCKDTMCAPRHACRRTLYNITVLKSHPRSEPFLPSEPRLPFTLRQNWFARKELITVGCNCLRDYVETN